MDSNVIFFAWNRSIPGREKISGEHFQEFVGYLQQQQENGTIDSFIPVLLDTHGGDLNGFFLIMGSGDSLSSLTRSDDWVAHLTRASLHLEGSGAVCGATGDELMKRMDLWMSLVS